MVVVVTMSGRFTEGWKTSALVPAPAAELLWCFLDLVDVLIVIWKTTQWIVKVYLRNPLNCIIFKSLRCSMGLYFVECHFVKGLDHSLTFYKMCLLLCSVTSCVCTDHIIKFYFSQLHLPLPGAEAALQLVVFVLDLDVLQDPRNAVLCQLTAQRLVQPLCCWKLLMRRDSGHEVREARLKV